jgi:hypothetical protein
MVKFRFLLLLRLLPGFPFLACLLFLNRCGVEFPVVVRTCDSPGLELHPMRRLCRE